MTVENSFFYDTRCMKMIETTLKAFLLVMHQSITFCNAGISSFLIQFSKCKF